MKKNLKIVFFGTPHFVLPVLRALQKACLKPVLVVTVPDKPADRGLNLKASPVKKWALKEDIDVIQPENLLSSDPTADILFNTEWDLFVVAGFGKILPKHILELPRHGTMNVHPSLLPRFRGPSPIESAILKDKKETGVSIILLDEQMDHGPIVAQASIAPEPWPFRRSALEELLWEEGGKLLAETIPPYIVGTVKPEAQDETKATYTPKLKKEDGFLDLSDDAYLNYLKFCAYEGWPGTYFFLERDGKKIRIKIADAAYTDSVFMPTRIIPEGKNEMDYEDFIRSTG